MRILAVVVTGLIVAGCQTAAAPPTPVPQPQTQQERCALLMGYVANQNISPSVRMMAMEAARNNECFGQRPPVRLEIR